MSQNAEELRRRNQSALADLERDAHKFAQRISFADEIAAVTDRERKIGDLEKELGAQRSRGYRFMGELEGKLADAKSRARTVLADVRKETENAGRSHRRDVDELARDVSRLRSVDAIGVGPQAAALDRQRDQLDAALDAVERRIKSLSEPFVGAFDEVEQGVKRIDDIMDLFEAGSFKLEPGEDAVNCVACSWDDAPSGAKTGLLLLTNQRIRFEHKEKIVTKKTMFFFAAETKDVQQLLIDEPVGHLKSSDDSTVGWVMKDQILTFAWDRPAKFQKTTFKLASGYAKDWDGVVERIKSGDIERDRVQSASAPAALDDTSALKFPSKCKECAAVLPKPVRGLRKLTCDYCGTTHDSL